MFRPLVIALLAYQMISPGVGGNIAAAIPSGGSNMTFGSAVRLSSFSAASSMTATAPTISGSNVVGVCLVVVDNSVTVSGVTWGSGNNMTAASGGSIVDGTRQLTSWTISSPTSAATITVTASGNWDDAFGSCSYYTNANTTTNVDTASSAKTGSACGTWNNSISTGHPNEFVVDVAFTSISVNPAPVSPSVLDEGGTNPNWGFASSHQGLISSAGSVAMDYTITGSPSDCAWVGVALHQ